MLWASLHFPGFPVQVVERGAPSQGPFAVAAGGNQAKVLACNVQASRAGVRPGMSLSAAYALAPGLLVRTQDSWGERMALEGIAIWAGQFTPTVSLAPPDTMLAEIGGCLRLFHGLPRLLEKLRAGLAELGYDALVAVAPTAEGACLFSRAGLELVLTEGEALGEQLARLTTDLLECPGAIRDILANTGMRTIGDCLRLPRDGFARRFGHGLLHQLDRALGRVPDPRPPFAPPVRWHAALALPAPAWEAEALLFGARRLVVELCGFLAAKQAGVTRLVLELRHEDARSTRVPVAFSLPCRDPERIAALLRERLATVALPDRVEAMVLAAEETAQLAPRNFSFFPDREGAGENRAALVERLRARLSEDAVHGLQLFPDARPELAWREMEPGTAAPALPPALRPAWLLARPRPLATRHGLPWLDGPLALLAGPERIESGWWDGNDLRRDYFVARDVRGARLWVFRERCEHGGWYLHGIFS